MRRKKIKNLDLILDAIGFERRWERVCAREYAVWEDP